MSMINLKEELNAAISRSNLRFEVEMEPTVSEEVVEIIFNLYNLISEKASIPDLNIPIYLEIFLSDEKDSYAIYLHNEPNKSDQNSFIILDKATCFGKCKGKFVTDYLKNPNTRLLGAKYTMVALENFLKELGFSEIEDMYTPEDFGFEIMEDSTNGICMRFPETFELV